MSDPDLEISGGGEGRGGERSSRLLDKGEGEVSKKKKENIPNVIVLS